MTLCTLIKCCAPAVLFAYLSLYILYAYWIDAQWMPEKPRSSPTKRKGVGDGPLIVHDSFSVDENSTWVADDGARVSVGWVGKEAIYALNGDRGIKRITLTRPFLQKFTSAAKGLQKREPHSLLLFSLINSAYLNLTLNWLCNTHALAAAPKVPKIHSSLLLVSLDGAACRRIKNEWPSIACLTIPTQAASKRFAREFDPGTHDFHQLMALRVNLLAALAEAKLPFLLLETDSTWFRNPLAIFANRSGAEEDADIVMLENPRNERGWNYYLAPMLVFAKKAARRALQELRRVVNKPNQDGSSPDDHPQSLLNALCARQYMGVVCRPFYDWEVVDGGWFKKSVKERLVGGGSPKSAGGSKGRRVPVIVENNVYRSVPDKQARMIINELWFLTTQQSRCNLQKARRLLKKYSH